MLLINVPRKYYFLRLKLFNNLKRILIKNGFEFAGQDGLNSILIDFPKFSFTGKQHPTAANVNIVEDWKWLTTIFVPNPGDIVALNGSHINEFAAGPEDRARVTQKGTSYSDILDDYVVDIEWITDTTQMDGKYHLYTLKKAENYDKTNTIESNGK